MTNHRLSETQRYFLNVLLEDGFDPSYQHVTTAFSFPQALDPEGIESIAGEVMARHAIVQTRLAYDRAEPVVSSADAPLPCTVVDLRDRSDAELDLWLSHFFDQPFDLGTGPLWRFAFVRGRDRTVWALAAHHLVADAASLWLLSKDLILRYFGRELDRAGPPFAEFLAEEQDLLSGPVARERLDYWSEQLAGAPLTILSDQRPHGRRLTAGIPLPVAFADDAGDALKDEARRRRVTPLPLLASYVVSAVKRAAHQDDVLSGVVTDLRGQRYGTTVGPFTDVMLVRDRLALDEDEPARLTKLRNSFFIGWQQQLPLAFLQDRLPALQRRPEPGHNPFDLLINFLPAPPATDWMLMMEVCGEATPALFFPRNRLAAPAKRFHAPLYIFLFALIERLDGWVFAHAAEELAELNAAIAEHLQREVGSLTALASA